MQRFHATRALFPYALAALLVPGCKGPAGPDGTNGTNGFNALVSTTTLSVGDSHCPNGGTEIDSGLDDGSGGGTAGDGVLQSGEITSTSYVCDPATALVKATPLAYGDANCPNGGTRIDTGLDDGSGGGTAGDGILQDGEITSTTYDCNDGQNHVGTFTAPDGSAGSYSIDAHGGTATADGSSGSPGGGVLVRMDNGSAGGHIKFFKTGQVDASFTFPAEPAAFDYGSQELEVDAETHVKPVALITDSTDANSHDLVDGDLVAAQCGSTGLYVWHSSSQDQVTGVHIASGGALIFDHSDGICLSRVVQIDRAFVNEGTLSTGHDTAGAADALALTVGSYYGGTGSTIDLSGLSSAGNPGGTGGDLTLSAASPGSNWGGLWNQGTIDTSGGNGDNAGSAGKITLWANSSLYNTGDLDARGGDAVTLDFGSSATRGGWGGPVDIETGYGSLYNSGAVDASGGSGSAAGAEAESISMIAGSSGLGDLYNSGDLRTVGGDADSSCDDGTCIGGPGANISLSAYGDLHTSGSLSAHGGAGRTGTGGMGGSISLFAESGENGNTVNHITGVGGAIWVSGDIETYGGDGAQVSGWGAGLSVEADPYYVPVGQEITFLGYGGGIDTRGGDGVLNGGHGGSTTIYQNGCAENQETCAWPAGSVINDVDVTSTGGKASTGTGGAGGSASWDTETSNYAVGAYGFERLINHGRIDTSGGQGGAAGGKAGLVWFYGLDGLDNEGSLTANGGDATAAGGTGGDATPYSMTGDQYGISLLADRGSVVNTAALSAAGGASTASSGAGVGGQGAGVLLDGPAVQNTGDVSGNGGDSNTTAGTGGDAANVVLESVQAMTDNSGALTAAGGAGATDQAGLDAFVVIDGQIVP